MGAISPKVVQLLKVKLLLEITRDGFSCFIDFQNFQGEDPRTPLRG